MSLQESGFADQTHPALEGPSEPLDDQTPVEPFISGAISETQGAEPQPPGPAAPGRPPSEPHARYTRVTESASFSDSVSIPTASSPYGIDLGRHERKCRVCQHPDREAIDDDFLHWHNPEDIAIRYKIFDRTSVYRHARALGLYRRRRSNMRCILEHILESASTVAVNAHSVLRALHAYGRVSDTGVWTDTPAQIVISTAPPAIRSVLPADAAPPLAAQKAPLGLAAAQLSENLPLPDDSPLSARSAIEAVLIATEMNTENDATH